MRIRTRLLLAFIGVLFPYLALASVGALGFQAVWKRIQSIQEEVVIKVRGAVDLEVAVLGLLQPPRDYVIFGDPFARDEFERRLADAQEVLARLGPVYVHDPEKRRLLEAVRYQIREIEVVSREILVSPAPRRNPATIARMKTLVVLSEVAAAALRRFREVTELEIAEEIRGGRSVVRTVTAGGVAAVVLSVAGGVGLALVFARWIGRPLRAIAEGSRRMAEGDLSQRIEADAGGELGEVARAFNEMAARVAESRASLEGRVAELAALQKVGATLTSTLHLPAVLEAIADSAVGLIGANRCAVFELNPNDQRLYVRGSRGMRADQPFIPMKLGQGAVGSAVLLRQVVFNPDVHREPLPMYDEEWEGTGKTLREVVRQRGYRAILAVPLVSKENVVGAICVYWDEAHSYDEREVRLLTAVAQQAAVAIENAGLHQRAEERARKLVALYEVGRRLAGAHLTEEVLSLIVNESAQLLGAEAAGLRLLEGDDLVVGARTESSVGIMASPRLKVGVGLSGMVVTSGEPLAVEDISQSSLLDPDDPITKVRGGFLGFLGVPLRSKDRIIGVLNVYTRTRRRFSPEDISVLSAFADQASLAIEKARLYQESVDRVKDLEEALARVRQLQGLLPICAWCKKVRRDQNYWQSVESYVTEHTDARFSHGICPECKGKLVTRRDANG